MVFSYLIIGNMFKSVFVEKRVQEHASAASPWPEVVCSNIIKHEVS